MGTAACFLPSSPRQDPCGVLDLRLALPGNCGCHPACDIDRRLLPAVRRELNQEHRPPFAGIRRDGCETVAAIPHLDCPAHNIPYVAQAVPSHWNDFITKVQKALAVKGPAFVNVLAPCRLGWQFDPAETIDIMRGAVETCFWPLYEVEDGKWRVTHKPREKKPVRGWLEKQGRFRHLFRPGNEHILEEIQADIDRNWEALLARSGAA
ncbi:MAG: hypothetical protein AB1700_02980 [Bacillota bacterium]